MKIAITGGGTGGHLTIAKAIKEELNKRGIKPVFIGSTHGQDRMWFENDDGFEEKYFFQTSGVVDKKGLAKLSSLFNILKHIKECGKIFDRHQTDIVFSVAGYSAAPASISALVYRKKLFLHEQNSITGRLNRVLKPFCTAFFCSFEKDSPVKDYPINEIFFKNARIREKIKTIIFLGGSQGAKAVNEYAMKNAGMLRRREIEIIHQCGKSDLKRVREFYEKNSIKAEVFDFTPNLADFIKKADFAVSRAGASTLFELSASALPTLFIPYPYAAANHQYYNALYLKNKNLAFLQTEDDLTTNVLEDILDKDLTLMSQGLSRLIKPDGAKKTVDFIQSLSN